MAQLNISTKATKQLTAISIKRKRIDAVVQTKKGITEDLIDKAFKKEIK